MRIIYILLVLLLSCGSAWGACGGSSPNLVPADGTVAAFEECVAAAQTGDTITLPSGSLDWSGGGATVNLSSSNIALNIKGGGKTATTITGDTTKFTITGGTGQWKLSDMTLSGDSHNAIAIGGVTTNWRIYNVGFSSAAGTSHRGVWVDAKTYGVIDNCTITIADAGIYIFLGAREKGNVDGGSASWQAASGLGTANAIFVENCTFSVTTPGSDSIFSSVFDADAGARVVVRYNTIENVHYTTHDAITTGLRAVRESEVYNNKWTYTESGQNRLAQIRGGTTFTYNNQIIGGEKLTFKDTSIVLLQNYRSFTDAQGSPVWNNLCDNTPEGLCPNKVKTCTPGDACSAEDGGGTCIQMDMNTDTTGWPCRDQIGRGQDSGANQASLPSLFWNNTVDGTAKNPGVDTTGETDTHIQLNRDYCIPACTGNSCSTTCNSVSISYAAYTCPHPLTGLTGSCDPTKAGAGLAGGYNVQLGTVQGVTFSGGVDVR